MAVKKICYIINLIRSIGLYIMPYVLHMMYSMWRHLIYGWLWQNSREQFLWNWARTSCLLNSFATIDPMTRTIYSYCFVMQVPSSNCHENKCSLILTDIIDIVQVLLCEGRSTLDVRFYFKWWTVKLLFWTAYKSPSDETIWHYKTSVILVLDKFPSGRRWI